MNRVEPNAFVTVDYVLRDDKGELLDESGAEGSGPIEYVHGYGMLVPGLEAALAGMSAGDKKDITIPPEEGFGERDEELVLEIGLDEFPEPESVEVGDEFVAESEDGDAHIMRVVEVLEDGFKVDANHPLAGFTLKYAVAIRSVREATPDEIEQAASELDEAHEHVHGPDCDHAHDPIVTLGKADAKSPGDDAKPDDAKSSGGAKPGQAKKK